MYSECNYDLYALALSRITRYTRFLNKQIKTENLRKNKDLKEKLYPMFIIF